jgi:cbb3-type cytochrome oxidase subunit 3
MDPLSTTTTTIAATVLSSSSGLRAYLPLFALGIAVIAGVVPLEHGYEVLTNPLVLGALGVLSVLEIVADKVPAVDHVSDVIHTAIRPIMGGIIFANTDNLVSMHSGVAAAIIGGVLAGGVHGAKALSRPAVTATTVGMGNPVVSVIEDIVTIALVVLAIVVPAAALILLVLFVVLFVLILRWAWRRLHRRKRQRAKVAGTGTSMGERGG